MISQSDMITSLTKTNFKRIVLPVSEIFTQSNYHMQKKHTMDIMIKQLTELDKVTNVSAIATVFSKDLEHKYKELMSNSSAEQNVNREGTVDYAKAKRVDYETYLSYTENEMMSVPSIVKDIIKCEFKMLLYGNKNPESYFKSLLVLLSSDFMIKNKHERNFEISKIKKEMALAVKTIFTSSKYTLLANGGYARHGFNKDKIIQNLLNRENYIDGPIAQISCDYLKKNIIVFDLVKKNFELYIHGPFDSILMTDTNIMGHFRKVMWHIIIQYQGVYMPVFCMDTHNFFSGDSFINKLMSEYEWTNPELYQPIISTGPNPAVIVAEAKPATEAKPVTVTEAKPVAVAVAEAKPATIAEVKPTTEQTKLLPITKYILLELQNLANTAGISITKSGKTGNMVAKTKQELYDELSNCPNVP